ncbi:unnamed protein product [Lathyrus sativus]|nr:unnamed protein product [Lathyrus sativus]
MNRPKSEGITFTKEPYIEDTGPRKIAGISFSTLSDTEIMKIGEVQVWKDAYYDPFKKPVPGGLLDSRLGPANKSLSCATCHGQYADCQGHYGYLPLVRPVFNVGYLSTIVKILKCICKRCACVFLDENSRKKHLVKMRNPKLDGLQKMQLLESIIKKYKTVKAIACPRCGYINGTFYALF